MTDALNDTQKEAILRNIPAGKLGGGADIAAAGIRGCNKIVAPHFNLAADAVSKAMN